MMFAYLGNKVLSLVGQTTDAMKQPEPKVMSVS